MSYQITASVKIFLTVIIISLAVIRSAKTKPTNQIIAISAKRTAEVTSSQKRGNSKRRLNSSPACGEASEESLRNQLMAHHNSQPLHLSYYMLPQLQTYLTSSKPARSGSGDEYPLYGRQECPGSLYDVGREKDVQDRSLCPWYNVLSHDPDRYPVDMVEARCKCTSCLGVGGGTGAGCEPVHYNVPVLWRSDTCLEDGTYKYENGWQKVAVGCTCAMAATR